MSANGFQALLNVADVDASIAFYGRFGFELVEEFVDGAGVRQWAQIRAGDGVFMLNRKDLISAVDRRARPAYGDAVFYVIVEDATATHRMLAAAGIDAPEPETTMYGALEFHIRDPDGYELAIGSRIEAEG